MPVRGSRTRDEGRREKLRRALGVRLEARAELRLRRALGDRDGSYDALEDEHALVTSRRAREVAAELREKSSATDAAWDAAIAAHLVRAAGEAARAELDDRWDREWTWRSVVVAEREATVPDVLRGAMGSPSGPAMRAFVCGGRRGRRGARLFDFA
jgi:hypothetical protein